jgi:hypothetical protein
VDIHTYGQQRKRECAEMSLDGSDISVADEAGNDQRGRLLGAAHLDEHASIHVHEVVVVEGENVHRVKYAYYLVVDDEEIGGYERDPTHPVAEHRHCGEHEPGGRPWQTVSFKEAASDAWEWLSEHPPMPEDDSGE